MRSTNHLHCPLWELVKFPSWICELLPIQEACERGKSQQDKLIRPGTELVAELLEEPDKEPDGLRSLGRPSELLRKHAVP